MRLLAALALTSLLAAVAWTPAAPAAEAPATPRPLPSFQENQVACAPVRGRSSGEVAALGGACQADWECTRAMPEYLQCGTWVHHAFVPPDDLVQALETSCAAVSLVPSCPDQVGACVAGRCTGRAPRRDPVACEAARATLADGLERYAACGAGAACSVTSAGGRPQPVTPGRESSLRAESHAVHDACPGEPPPHVPAAPPEQVEKGCIGRSVRIPRDLARFAGKVTLRFRVSPRGVAHGFSVEGSPDPRLDESLALAVSRCELRPALEDGAPHESASSMEMRFVGSR